MWHEYNKKVKFYFNKNVACKYEGDISWRGNVTWSMETSYGRCMKLCPILSHTATERAYKFWLGYLDVYTTCTFCCVVTIPFISAIPTAYKECSWWRGEREIWTHDTWVHVRRVKLWWAWRYAYWSTSMVTSQWASNYYTSNWRIGWLYQLVSFGQDWMHTLLNLTVESMMHWKILKHVPNRVESTPLDIYPPPTIPKWAADKDWLKGIHFMIII